MADRKINIVAVGIGGRGSAVLRGLETENIIGLCDVDWKYAAPVFERYPQAKRFNDYRVMFADDVFKKADAVVVATADHTHAIIAAEALAAGKHVYCEKPLTHSVYESRLLAKLAEKHQVATQMGNQGSSNNEVRKAINWLWNGEIGEVTKVEVYTDRPIWPQGLERPKETMPVPSTLNWDAFIGPAPMRPYHSIYHPWNFRGWWDFGTGALGDMACHLMYTVFEGLKLKYPSKVQGSSTLLLNESCPQAESVKFTFPARDNLPKVGMPEVDVYWYDGGIMPDRPELFKNGESLCFGYDGGSAIFYGTKDTMIVTSHNTPRLVSGRIPESVNYVREIKTEGNLQFAHQQDWVRACKEPAETRVPTASDFRRSGPFNEMVVMGVVAVRLQSLNQILEWDGEKMEFTNIPADATIRTVVHDGFTIKEGHPTFNKDWTEPVNAREFAAELIKHTYHNGYKLPDMP